MVAGEETVIVLLLILALGLIIPELFKKLRLPIITILIIIGAIMGPAGLGYVQSNDVIDFFGLLGSAFLMLMAGLQVDVTHFNKVKKKVIGMSLINGLIPFAFGVILMRFYDYSWISSLLVGTVFMSSSIAIIAATMKNTNLIEHEIGQVILSATILEDISSLFLLAIILQILAPVTNLPLFVYFTILIISVIVLKMFLPEFAIYWFKKHNGKKDVLESELKFVIVLMLTVLAYFAGLGVHPIVAAFLVGLLLSDVIKSQELRSKLHTIGYGVFVPVFFFIIGMGMDFSAFKMFSLGNVLMVLLILGLIFVKIISGFVSGRIFKFGNKESWLFGIASSAQLTTTLVAVYAASQLGLLDSTVTTSIIILSIITTIIVPIGLNKIKIPNKKKKEQKKVGHK
ncbi:MAG: cation:proton antiporter [Nanoarchaeota archaeon]|nr:cation:proton antiporter [Nanoarchaeota archaeon]